MVLLFFTYCKEEPTEPIKEKPSLSKSFANSQNDSLKISAVVTVDSTKDKSKDKGKSIIVPDAVICGTLDKYYWEFDHYETTPGKIVGILPTPERFSSVQRLAEVRNKWGFCNILAYEGYLGVVFNPSVGYDVNHTMLFIDPSWWNWKGTIINNPTTYAYYVDEPVTGHGSGTGVQYMQNAHSWIQTNRPGSILVSGETVPGNAWLFQNSTEMVLCTRYCVDGSYFCMYPDQRPLWSDFKSLLPIKFTSTWIGAHADLSSYDELLGHASNLGLTSVWLYQQDDNTDAYSDNNISTFSHYAWKWGWMRKYERQWIYVYRCTKQNPCDCDRNNITDGWELERAYRTSDLRIVYY